MGRTKRPLPLGFKVPTLTEAERKAMGEGRKRQPDEKPTMAPLDFKIRVERPKNDFDRYSEGPLEKRKRPRRERKPKPTKSK